MQLPIFFKNNTIPKFAQNHLSNAIIYQSHHLYVNEFFERTLKFIDLIILFFLKHFFSETAFRVVGVE